MYLRKIFLNHVTHSKKCREFYKDDEIASMKKESKRLDNEKQKAIKRQKKIDTFDPLVPYARLILCQGPCKTEYLRSAILRHLAHNELCRSAYHDDEINQMKKESKEIHYLKVTSAKKGDVQRKAEKMYNNGCKKNLEFWNTAITRLHLQIDKIKECDLTDKLEIGIRFAVDEIEGIHKSLDHKLSKAYFETKGVKRSLSYVEGLFEDIEIYDTWWNHMGHLELQDQMCRCIICLEDSHFKSYCYQSVWYKNSHFVCNRVLWQRIEVERGIRTMFDCPVCHKSFHKNKFGNHYNGDTFSCEEIQKTKREYLEFKAKFKAMSKSNNK